MLVFYFVFALVVFFALAISWFQFSQSGDSAALHRGTVLIVILACAAAIIRGRRTRNRLLVAASAVALVVVDLTTTFVLPIQDRPMLFLVAPAIIALTLLGLLMRKLGIPPLQALR